MLLSSDTKLTPFQLKELNRRKWEEIHGDRELLPRVVAKNILPKRATKWSKNRTQADVLPRALRHARSAKFIPREGW